MNRLYTSLFALLIAVAASAQINITGAAVTYEHVGSNDFVATVQLTVSCPDLSSANWSNYSLASGVPLSLDTIIPLDSACTTPGGCYVSGSSFPITNLVILKTAPLNISKPSAGNPEVFRFEIPDTNRFAANSNLVTLNTLLPTAVEAVMYGEGYPRSSTQVVFVEGDFKAASSSVDMSMPYFNPHQDSTVARLVSARDLQGVAYSYNGGMSGTSPVPNVSGYHSPTGRLDGSGLATGTRYFITQEVESYVDGALSNEIRFDRGFIAFTNWTENSTINLSHLSSSVPVLAVDTLRWYATAHVSHGDTLNLGFSVNTMGSFVGMEYEYETTPTGPSSPTITPLSGFSNPTFLPQIDFEYHWVPDSLSPKLHRVLMKISNGDCPPITQMLVMDIFTDDPVIPTDTLRACSGEIVNLPIPSLAGSQPNWVPSSGVACGLNGCVTFADSSKLLEYFVDGYVTHRVYLEVVSAPSATISASGSNVQLQNPANWTNAEWFHFGVRVPNQSNTNLVNAPWGLYQGRFDATNLTCPVESNLTGVNMPQSLLSVFNTAQFTSGTSTLQVGDTISYLVEKDGPLTVWPQSVIIPGTALNSSMEMRVYKGGSLQFTSQGQDLNGMAVEFDLPHNGSGANLLWRAFDTIRFVFEVTSGTQVIPAGDTIHNGRTYGDVRMRRTTGIPGTSQIMPMVIQTYPGVGLNENELNSWSVYPNPSTGSFFIDGVEGNPNWSVIDLSGRRVDSGVLERNQLQLRHLEAGFYFFRIGDEVEKIQVIR